MFSEQDYQSYLQNTAAPLVPYELTGAYGDIYNYNNIMSALATPMGMGQMMNLLSGNYMDASKNPYVQGIINSSQQTAQDFYNTQSANTLAGLTAQGNRTGGSTAINAQANIASQLANQLANISAQTGMGAYNTGFQGMMSALQPALNYPMANAGYLSQLYGLQQQSLMDPLTNWANWNTQGQTAISPNVITQPAGTNPWAQAATGIGQLAGTLGQFNNWTGGQTSYPYSYGYGYPSNYSPDYQYGLG